MKKSTVEQLPVFNPHAAAIDVGSRNHYVAVGQDVEKDVRAFGIYSKDHQAMLAHFKER